MDRTSAGGTMPDEEALRAQLLRLRLSPDLEAQFRRDHEASAPGSRLVLIVMALLLIGATPLYDVPLLKMPEALLLPARLLQFAVQIPAILLALLCLRRPSLRPWSAPALVFATLVVAAGLEAQRVLAAGAGFHVPQVFVVLTLTAALVLGRLRLFYFLPWALLAMVVNTAVEVRAFGTGPSVIYDCISTWMLFLLAVTGAWFREHAERRSWHQQHRLEYEARHDWLTGLTNRGGFETELRERVAQSLDAGRPLWLLLLDLDGFAPYNDRYGHPAGDDVLRQVAVELERRSSPPQEFCARVGGEEFALLWSGLGSGEARERADHVRRSIRALGIPNEAMVRGARLSASAGLAELELDGDDADPKRLAARLQRRAEEALHQAKAEGRDRLVVAPG